MSNLIPPLLSSSPPPIVGPLDEDDDDEFGDFRAATNSYDCDDFSSPPSPEKVIVKNDETATVLDINSNNNDGKSINITEINETLNCEGNQKDFQDKRKISGNDLKSDNQVSCCNSLSDDNSSTFHEDCDGNKIDNSDDNGPNIDDINTETCDSKSDELESIESDKIDGKTIDNSDDFETDFVEKDPSNSDNSIQSDNCNNSQMIETKIDDKLNDDDDDFNDFQTIECKIDDNDNSNNSQTIETEIKSNQIENDNDDDDEFNDFPIIERGLKDNQTDNENFANFPTEIDEHQIDNSFADFQSNLDDDFGDFEAPPPLQQIQPTDDDDFDDFSAFTSNQPILLLDSNEVLNKCETIVKEIFPEIETNDDIDEEFRYINATENDQVFNLLKDVTETNALKYQWSKSSSQKILLKSLNIDMRNILYGPGWNSCMPRFASNLGLAPLEPIKPEILTPTPVQQQSSPSIDSSQKEQINNVDIPNAQFDWNDSGLINPLDYSQTILLDLEQLVASLDIPTTTTITNPSPSLSNDLLDEWDIWLQSAPSKKEPTKQHLEEPNPIQEKSDLFLATITEKIKNLTTTTPTTIESPKMIPLRETHISNDNNINLEEKPDWFQSTVQTPDLPRKPEFIDNDVDDFDDFQMVLPENETITTTTDPDLRIFDNLNRQPVEEVITIQNNNNNNNNKTINDDNEDEFTDFHSSLPTVLQPIPLQPLKPSIVNQLSTISTQINWPEPGVSDEEIRNIELSYTRNKIEENQSNQLVKNNRCCEDDEWSDFVSVIPTPKPIITTIERTATPDLPLSVLNLNYIQPAKPPIPVITPNGLVQTKLSTDNCAPKSTNIVQRKISTNYQQPTLITNQFNNLSANFDLTPIKPTPIQILKPITQSGNNENIDDDDDDDDWSDFVSSQPPVNGYQMKVNQTNITTNPNFDTFQNYPNPIRKNSFINGQPNIATIPDLDFIAPKSRNKK